MTAGVPGDRPVSLNGRAYVIEPAKSGRRSLPMLRASTWTGADSGDAALSAEGPWREKGSNWQGGAGQLRFDEGGDPNRFYLSKGVDPFEQGQITPLKIPAQCLAPAGTLKKHILSAAQYLYATQDDVIKFAVADTVNPSSYTSCAAPLTPTGAPILSIASDGSSVWAIDVGRFLTFAVGSGLLAQDVVGGWEKLWYANGYLFAGYQNKLYTLNAAGTGTLVATLYNGLEHVESVVGAPNGVYISTKSNTYAGGSAIYYLGVDEATGALLPLILACPWPADEVITKLAFHGRWIFICSNKGIRLAEVTDSKHLVYGSRITIAGGVNDITFVGDRAYFTWNGYDGDSGLGCLYLGYFTDPDNLVPAYASAEMVDTLATGVIEVCTVGDRVYFCVDVGHSTLSGFYGPGTAFQTDAWLDQGRISFNTIEPKTPYQATIVHEPLAGSIAVSSVDPSAVTTLAGTSATALSRGPSSPFSLPTTQVEHYRLRFDFTRGSSSTAPTMTRWLTKALPAATQTEELVLAIIMAETVLPPGGEEGDGWPYDPKAEWDLLKVLERTKVPFTAIVGDETFTVRLDTMGIDPSGWTDGHHFWRGLFILRLLTL